LRTAVSRVALGSTTYDSIRDALTRRLAELEASKAITLATDVDDEPARAGGSSLPEAGAGRI
jgi:hypothetical protein